MAEATITILAEQNSVEVTNPEPPIISLSTASMGVTDHGQLVGLEDDDHPHYHNDTRGDYRYTPYATARRRTEFFRATFTMPDQPLKNTYTDSGHYWRGGDEFLVSGGTVVQGGAMPASRQFLMCDGMTRDIELLATIHIGTDADVGIMGRCYQDTSVNTKLYVSLRKTSSVNTIRLIDKDGVALATVNDLLADNTTYQLRWVMNGTQHTVFLDGTQVVDETVSDQIYSDYAGVGITYNGGYANTDTWLDDMIGVALTPPEAVVLAHRGTTWALGETTEQKLSTFAGLPPVTGVECDVRLSSDSVPVLMHDATVDRTCPPFTGAVDSFTADELARMGVPTLEEYLNEAQRYGHTVLMQTQVPNTSYASIMAVLNTLPSQDKIIFGDYSNTNLQAARTAGFTGPTLLFGATLANVATLVGHAPDYIAIAPGDASYITNRAAVTTIKNAGIIPVASTVNRGDAVKAAVEDGAALLTDVADLCATALTPAVDRPRLHPDIATKAYVDVHDAASDPHPQYLTAAEADAAYLNASGDTMEGRFTAAELQALNVRNDGLLVFPWGDASAQVALYPVVNGVNGNPMIYYGGEWHIASVATPVNAGDAANKQYVDGRIWKGTQAQYDALGVYDPDVLYVVTG